MGAYQERGRIKSEPAPKRRFKKIHSCLMTLQPCPPAAEVRHHGEEPVSFPERAVSARFFIEVKSSKREGI
jgi:hypothetical protein